MHPPHFSFFLLLFSFTRIATSAYLPILRREACPVILPQLPSSRSHPRPRIIGGIQATPFSRSFLVSLSDPNNHFRCSASLLSPRWVLTAAHCNPTIQWLVRIAPERATYGQTTPIRRIIPHRSFDRNTSMDTPGDITLIELMHDAPSFATFVLINVNASAPVSGAFARSVGYGRTLPSSDNNPNPQPNQVDGPVNSPKKCAQIYHGFMHVLRQYFICVGYGKDGCLADSCHGDSGGPLVQFDRQNRVVQIGIVSFGLDCGTKGVPGVYVRLSAFVDWMQAMGAVFGKSSDTVSLFAEGSEEAASDVASVTIAQIENSEVDEEEEVGTDKLTISKVTFAIICVIAGICLIALIFLSLIYVSGRERCGGGRVNLRHSRGGDHVEIGQRNPPYIPPLAENSSHDNLQLAISILQSISNEQAQRATNGHWNRDSLPEESDTTVNSVPRDQIGDIAMEEVTTNSQRRRS